MKKGKWFELPDYGPDGVRCPLCNRNEADPSPQGCHCWDEQPNNGLQSAATLSEEEIKSWDAEEAPRS